MFYWKNNNIYISNERKKKESDWWDQTSIAIVAWLVEEKPRFGGSKDGKRQ